MKQPQHDTIRQLDRQRIDRSEVLKEAEALVSKWQYDGGYTRLTQIAKHRLIVAIVEFKLKEIKK